MPVTSPESDPLKLVVVVAVVALVALPFKAAVMVPAAKLPEASRLTMVLTVSALVAALAAVVAEATLAADWPPTVLTTVADCVPVTSPESDPLKLVAVVAVVALPIRAAVIVPAEKLPLASRTTISLAMFELEIAASFVLAIVVFVISLLTMSELDKLPDALL